MSTIAIVSIGKSDSHNESTCLKFGFFLHYCILYFCIIFPHMSLPVMRHNVAGLQGGFTWLCLWIVCGCSPASSLSAQIYTSLGHCSVKQWDNLTATVYWIVHVIIIGLCHSIVPIRPGCGKKILCPQAVTENVTAICATNPEKMLCPDTG